MNTITRRLAIALSAAGVFTATHAAWAADLAIYSDSLASPWQNWSWDSTVSFNNAIPANGGSGASVSVTYNAAWAGLYLHANGAVSAAAYSSIRFFIHGGGASSHGVRLYAVDASMASGPGVQISPIAPGVWNLIEIPVSSLGVATIGGLVWQDTTGAPQPAFYIDDVALIEGGGPPPPPGVGPALTVDAAANAHPISPYIYGINFGGQALVDEIRPSVRRWGGNSTTRYNYLLDTHNTASDWYFENIPDSNPNPAALPNGSNCDQFIAADAAAQAQSIITIPLIGWTPKARQMSWGFSIATYGAQQQTDPWQPDAGNGVKPNGSFVTGNNPADTSIAIGPSFVQGWIAHLISTFGPASQGGVRFYDLDNEPDLWNSTHRDVHPNPPGYDELRDRGFLYAAAVKEADPGALTLGPVSWGWTGYFYSALDWAPGGAWWNNPQDRLAHGNIPFVEWYLQQMKAYEQAHDVRLLDYLDLHYYPQASGVALSPAGSLATQALRLRSTRSLWDPTYVDESWIGEPVKLLPRMRAWTSENYPGTKTAVTEYNWGALDHINGALAQADVLGIFGREGLDLATLWDPPEAGQPGAFVFGMYRGHDGEGSGFGATSVSAHSADQDAVSIYAARRSDGALTLMLINKQTQPLDCALNVTGFSAAATAAAVYRYDGGDLSHIIQRPDLPMPGLAATISLSASSITLLVIPGFACGDVTGDAMADIDDLFAVINAWGPCPSGAACPADIAPAGASGRGDGAVNVDDLFAVINSWGPCP